MAILAFIDKWLGRASGIFAFWPLVPAGVVGGMTAYLSTWVQWINQFGPFGWWASAILGVLLTATIYLMMAIAYSRWITTRMIRITISKSNVNPLEDRFDRKVIRLIDFYSPYYTFHKNKDFRKCDIIGPGLVYFKGFHADSCSFIQVQIVIVAEDKQMWGMTAFENSKMVDCNILNLTMIMNRATYDAIDAEIKQNIPVINGRFP